ncbi:MAG: hypothetical protein ACFCGT_14030 [Sandaracinaceae bacterium]
MTPPHRPLEPSWGLGPLLCAAMLVPVAPAGAQDLAGSAHLHGLVTSDVDVGAAVAIDLHVPVDVLRLGAFVIVGAIPSDNDDRNRVFMPLGLSASLELAGDLAGVSLRARGGMWAGATQSTKITAGGFLGGGVYLLLRMSETVTFNLGLDLWGILGAGEQLVYAPSLGVSWVGGGP